MTDDSISQNELDYLKGRFCALEHIVLVGIMAQGRSRVDTITKAIEGVSVEDVLGKRMSTSFGKGMRDQFSEFIKLGRKK